MRDTSANRGIAAPLGDRGRSPAEIERDLAIADLVDLRLLRAGRAASLFRAHQVATQRTVAVKVLHDELSSDTGQRFDRERAITGQLSGHTGIVPLFHTGSTSDGEPYLVMPYYYRGSLADLMTRYGPLSWREATFILEPVAVTLSEVHGRDLVHRNLKPGNVLLTDFLLPRVADFGMCLPTGQTSTAATLVEDSPYGAPEVVEPGPADPSTDVYGLGATLVGLLSGRAPSDAKPDSTGPITPEPIAELIQRSMAIEPSHRPGNAAAFVTELRHAVARSGATPGARPTAPDGLGPDPAFGELLTRGATASVGPSTTPSDTGGPSEPVSAEPKGPGPEDRSRPASTDETGRTGRLPGRARSELYLLLLVAVLTTGILAMVLAAVVTVQ